MLRRHRTRDPRYAPLIDAAQPAVAAAIAVLRRMPYAELEALGFILEPDGSLVDG